MATESERTRGSSAESRESRGERRDRTEPTAASTRSPETAASAPDAVAIDAARARALAAGSTAEPSQSRERPLIDFADRAKDVTVGVGKGGLQVLGGSLVVATYLGYQVSRPVLYTTARFLDWIGHKMNGLADKLIDKKMPIVSWILNPVINILDSAAKSIGLDKRLAEHLKKNAEDRKKVAEKILKDYKEAQKKQEKKEDDSKKKGKRREKIEQVFGKDVAEVLEEEFDEFAKDEESTTAPAPVEEKKTA